jgi:hypothetical protein
MRYGWWFGLAAASVWLPSISAQTTGWNQPPIRTGSDSVELLPWAPTIQVALARAAKEKKLVLATVVAVSDDHWVSGYAGAEAIRKPLSKPVFGDDLSMALDEGLRKERVMMAAWFADAEVTALVQKHFVPVRVRCRPWDFDLDIPDDPLTPLGTRIHDIGAPALVVAKSDGTCVHTLGRIGVFAPSLAAPTLRAALGKAGVHEVAASPASTRKETPPDAAAFAQRLGIQLGEWTKGAPLEFDPLAHTTEVDATKQPIDRILGRAADVLLVLQSEDGGWHNPAFDVRTNSGAGTTWDYEVARTGLVVDALLSLRERLPKRKIVLEAAARRGIELVGKFADAPQPWIWQATYALHLQVALLRSDLDAEKPKARERAARLVTTLVGLQQDGGWSYMPSPRTHSFNTAPVLLLFGELQALGVDVPKDAVTKAQGFLASLRNPADERDYWYAPAMKFEPRAASCRSALCELALLDAGDKGAVRRLEPAIEFFFEHEAGARSVTKVYESFLSPKSLQDAYHYYFGHYYVARALARLPKENAAKLAQRQLAILRKQVEADGSFVDAQAQGKSYSTAMAVLTLLEDLRWTKP